MDALLASKRRLQAAGVCWVRRTTGSPVDLFLRPEWDPAGDDCAHRGPNELDAADGQLAVWNGRKQRK